MKRTVRVARNLSMAVEDGRRGRESRRPGWTVESALCSVWCAMSNGMCKASPMPRQRARRASILRVSASSSAISVARSSRRMSCREGASDISACSVVTVPPAV
eukprot:scaffold59638_cov29-Tisochrysis_lutea.AAC.1